ncbi:hypothetical protein KSP40_PGU003063 [Platanthera guangdongensis]|uniref:Uncharacterized protein n=1 Tax=Platanthera guangdongensis TaxID=2320717 RepID=A0ABR2N3L7_9ASPA
MKKILPRSDLGGNRNRSRQSLLLRPMGSGNSKPSFAICRRKDASTDHFPYSQSTLDAAETTTRRVPSFSQTETGTKQPERVGNISRRRRLLRSLAILCFENVRGLETSIVAIKFGTASTFPPTEESSSGAYQHVIGKPEYQFSEARREPISIAFLHSYPAVSRAAAAFSGAAGISRDEQNTISTSEQLLIAAFLLFFYHIIAYVYI